MCNKQKQSFASTSTLQGFLEYYFTKEEIHDIISGAVEEILKDERKGDTQC